MTERPADLASRLLGHPAPTVSLPWTTYADMHDALGPGVNTSLAALAARGTLIVYFFPAETEGNFAADTMSRAFRDRDNEITQARARVVGVSTQPALEQQQIAVAELFPQLLLADAELRLADELRLPTIEIDGRDEYEPMTIMLCASRIAHVIYPIPSPSAHIAEVLSWLAQREETTDMSTDRGRLVECAHQDLGQQV
jgi:peroxiredoxin